MIVMRQTKTSPVMQVDPEAMDGWRFWFGYRWWRVRCWVHGLPERLAWKIAWRLPRQVALIAFIRVYSVLGECGPDYENAYKLWESGKGR